MDIVKSGSVVIKIEKKYNAIVIEIRDTGSGIPREIIDKVGKSKITFGKSNGNGFGLLHAYQQVCPRGGDIQIVSNESQGAAVTIILPFLATP